MLVGFLISFCCFRSKQ